MQRAARRRAIVAGVVFVLGVAILIAGVLASQPVILGIIGFVVMLGAATIGVTAVRHPAARHPSSHHHSPRETRHEGFGVVDGGRRHQPRQSPFRSRASGSFMERMEQRWRHRRDQGY